MKAPDKKCPAVWTEKHECVWCDRKPAVEVERSVFLCERCVDEWDRGVHGLSHWEEEKPEYEPPKFKDLDLDMEF